MADSTETSSQPSVTVVTAAYNKPVYLADAARSLLAQNRKDWVWWLILNGPTPEVRKVAEDFAALDSRIKVFEEWTSVELRTLVYMPALISNKFNDLITTPYFCWFSDDDILEPNYIEELAGALDSDPNKDIVFGECKVIMMPMNDPPRWVDFAYYPADRIIGKGTGISPWNYLDGGQVMQRTSTWRFLRESGWLIPMSWNEASYLDGVYGDALARHYTYYPVPKHVFTKRKTQWATFGKSAYVNKKGKMKFPK